MKPPIEDCPAFVLLKEKIQHILDQTSEAQDLMDQVVQWLANTHNRKIATGHMSDTWQVSAPRVHKFGDYFDKPGDPTLAELKKLDETVAEIRIGPSNCEMYKPQKVAKEEPGHAYKPPAVQPAVDGVKKRDPDTPAKVGISRLAYKVSTFRSIGFEAKWGRTSKGAPIILVRLPAATLPHQRDTWWAVTGDMLNRMDKEGIMEGFYNSTALGDVFNIPT